MLVPLAHRNSWSTDRTKLRHTFKMNRRAYDSTGNIYQCNQISINTHYAGEGIMDFTGEERRETNINIKLVCA